MRASSALPPRLLRLRRRRQIEFPRLADQRRKLGLRHARGLDDDVGGLAPHELDEGLGIGLEQELLALHGQMQKEPVVADDRKDALLRAERGAAEMIDLAHAVERERELAEVGDG